MPWPLVAALLLLQDPTPTPTPGPEKKVVVTASPLDPKDVGDVPYRVELLPRADIDRALPRTTPELLREVPGVNVQKTSNGQGSPFLRGFTGFRTVLLVDGIRLNHAAFRDGPNQYWNTVDSFLVDRVEVLFGPSSVLHGSDAIGGTVYLHTRGVESFPDELTWTLRGVGRYASAEDSLTERAEFTVANARGAVVGGLTVRDYDDVVGGRHTGEQPRTGYDEYDADLKAVVRLGAKGTLTFAAQRTRQDDAWRTHRTVYGREWHGTTVGTDLELRFDQERDLYYAQARWDDLGSVVDSLQLSLSLQRQAEDSMRVTSALKRELRDFEVSTPGFFARAARRLSIGRLTFGVEAYRDRVDSDALDRTAAGVETDFERGEVAGDSTLDLLALFVQDEIDLGTATTLTLGLRQTRQKLDAGDVDPSGFGGPSLGSFTETYSNLSGSVRLLWRPSEDWDLVAGISQGFRAPNLDDTTAVRLVMSGQTDFPNPDLDPETSLNYELGARWRRGSVRAQAFVFHTQLKDFIGRVPAPSIGPTAFTKENFSDGFVRGVEGGIWIDLDEHWCLWLDGSAAVGELDALVGAEVKSQPISKLNPAAAHLGARFRVSKDGPWAELLVTAVHAQEHLSPSDETDTQRIPPGGTPGFTVLTLRGGMALTKRIQGTLSIENLADRDYRWHGSGTNEPGTNVIVGIDARY